MAGASKVAGRVVLGITGTRTVEDDDLLRETIRTALREARGLFALASTPVVFTILSPLAEGADRIAAQEVLAEPGGRLEAVLPLPVDDYASDFVQVGSLDEFRSLRDRAQRVTVLPPAEDRASAYEAAGRYVVDRCDVLIAVWDGLPAAGRGGTAEIIEYARRRRQPLYWIDTSRPGRLAGEWLELVEHDQFADLDRFNRVTLDDGRVERARSEFLESLAAHRHRAGMGSERLAGLEPMVGPFVRADLAAQRYQRLYGRAGIAVYLLAAAAVGAAAIGIIWDLHALGWAEVAFTVGIVALVYLGNRHRWQQRWIDYRFLAERLRTAIYMNPAGWEASDVTLPRHLSLAYSSHDWMLGAFRGVAESADLPPPLTDPDLEAVRRFVLEGWVDDQIGHHRRAAARDHRRNNLYARGGLALFVITAVAAVLSLTAVPHAWEKPLFFAGVALPAVGGAIAAIRSHRELHRNALRGDEMVRHLSEIRTHLASAPTVDSFLQSLGELEQTMVNENADWRVVVRFHELEPPA